MRLRRNFVAHSAATIVCAGALGACGASDSSLASPSDAGGAAEGQARDASFVAADAASPIPGVDGSTPDVPADGGVVDTTSTADVGASDAPLATEGAAVDEAASADVASPEGGTTPADAAPAVSADAPSCSALVNAAPTVQVTVSNAGTPPASSGGTLVSGTYFLTAVTSYSANPLCAAASLEETALVVAASPTSGTLDLVASVSLVGTQQTTHADYTSNGSVLSLLPTCPATGAGATLLQYTATPGRVDLTVPSPVSTCGLLVEVFTKQ